MIRFSAALLLILSSCSYDKLTPLQRWEAQFVRTDLKPALRNIAQSPAETCSSSLMSRENIELLIRKEEQKKVLSLFGSGFESQASQVLMQYFVATSGKYILPHKDQGACQSVDCLYEPYYGKGKIENLWAYLWWLRTHTVLAVANDIPNRNLTVQNGEHRFSSQEIMNFLEEALSTETLSKARSLKVIYRIAEQLNYDPKYCGLASSTGYIFLLDKCLTPKAIKISLLHEFGHHFDFTASGSPYHDFSISSDKEWLDLSGWSLVEIKDANTGHTVERKWVFDASKDGFVRAYASTSPMEDWAESFAYYKVNPGLLETHASNKSAYIKVKGYDNEAFDLESVISKLFLEKENEFNHLILKCFEDLSASSDKVSACINSVKSEYASFSLDELRARRSDVCDLINKNLNESKRIVESKIVNLADRISKDTEYFLKKHKVMISFEAKLKLIDISIPFIFCFATPNDNECYTNKIIETINELLPEGWKQFEPEVLARIENFLSQNNISVAELSTSNRYRRMFANASGPLQKLAEAGWSRCKNELKSDKEIFVDKSHSTPTDQYVRYSVRSCLENYVRIHLLDTLNQSIQQEFQVKDRQAELFLVSEFSLDFWSHLNVIIKDSVTVEVASVSALAKSAGDMLVTKLLEDTSWIREAMPIENSCKGQAQRLLRTESSGFINRIYNLIFHSPDDLIMSISSDACLIIAQNSQIKVLFSGSRTEQLNASFQFLRDKVKERVGFYSENCTLSSFGKIVAKWEFVSEKTACVLQNSAKISKESFDLWNESPYGQKFASNRAMMWNYLVQNITSIIKQSL